MTNVSLILAALSAEPGLTAQQLRERLPDIGGVVAQLHYLLSVGRVRRLGSGPTAQWYVGDGTPPDQAAAAPPAEPPPPTPEQIKLRALAADAVAMLQRTGPITAEDLCTRLTIASQRRREALLVHLMHEGIVVRDRYANLRLAQDTRRPRPNSLQAQWVERRRVRATRGAAA